MDDLYSNGIITSDDMEDLFGFARNKDKNRRLMIILNRSGNDKTFVLLRSAIEKESAYSWFINRLDKIAVDSENVEEDEIQIVSATSALPPGIIHLCTAPLHVLHRP